MKTTHNISGTDLISSDALRAMTVAQLSELVQRTVATLAERGSLLQLSQLTASTGKAVGIAATQTSPMPLLPTQDARNQFALTFHAINESQPGVRWQELFKATWPAYKSWYQLEDGRSRPSVATAQAMLSKHMPELVPTYRRLVELTAGDETACRMLTMWDPPRFAPGCSQAVLIDSDPILCRNYDYSPDLFERVIYSSRFAGRKVIGTSDCLWGLLDGMNDAGLAVSLAFGGRPGSGAGFGIPLVVRYLLEVADTTAQARRVLERIPVSMAYNLTMVDADGRHLTAYVSPDRAAEFTSSPIATNHRGEIPEFPEHATRFRSVQRRGELTRLVAARPSATELVEAFLKAPLYSTDYAAAFGTLYTALYRPLDGVVEYNWPGGASWIRGFDDPDAEFTVMLRER